MNGVKLIEDGQLSGTRLTSDGYLVGSVRCARTGIQQYSGAELGLMDMSVVRVYRPEDEVFSKGCLASFAGKPATNNHPNLPVTADNWRQHAVGSIGEDIARDGEYVRVPLILMDGDAIKAVQDGKRELSMGYTCDFVMESGTTPQGEAYDAVQRNLRMNHVAIVSRGRAGSEVRIGDTWSSDHQSTREKSTMTTRTIVVDGLTVETTDAGAVAIEKLQGQLSAANDAATQAQAAHDAAIATKDSELAKRDSEIESLKGKVLDGAALDALVADRAALVAKAEAVADGIETAGKSAIEIKTAAVAAVRGSDFAKDKSEAYIEAAFDMLEAPKDPVRDALSTRQPAQQMAQDHGQSAYEKRLNDAWKGTTAEGTH